MNAHRLVLTCLVLCSPVARADRLVLVAGGGVSEDGVQTKLVAPFGVDFDAAGNLYLVEMAGGERVRKMGRDGVLQIIAGTGTKGFSGDNGPGKEAQFNGMHSLAVLPDGKCLFYAKLEDLHLRAGDLCLAHRGSVVSDSGVSRSGAVTVPPRIDCWSRSMPREIRERTVPIGTWRMSAISLYEYSSK
jgi:hypothetical protein